MSGKWNDLPFSVLSVPVEDGHRRTVVRFVCSTCEAKEEYGVGTKVIPEMIVKQATRNGWRVSLNSTKATCPKCVRERKKSAPGESPKTLLLAPKPMENPAPMATTPTPFTRPVQMTAPKPPMAAPPTQGTPKPTVIEPLGVKDRIRVRGFIMEHFDEERGCWKKGWNDTKVAIEATVEVQHVTEMREAAFGPIRTTEEAELARDNIAKLKQQMQDQITLLVSDTDLKIGNLRTLMNTRIAEIEKLLASVEKAA